MSCTSHCVRSRALYWAKSCTKPGMYQLQIYTTVHRWACTCMAASVLPIIITIIIIIFSCVLSSRLLPPGFFRATLSSSVLSMCGCRIIPGCVARVPVSLWGTLRNRSQPSATVRDRSQPSAWGPYGRAYGKFCKRDHFWRFETARCFVSRGKSGTSWHDIQTCFVTCGKSFCVAGAIL